MLQPNRRPKLKEWINPFLIDEQTILEKRGLDTYLFVRYIRLVMIIATMVAFTTVPILLSIYYHGASCNPLKGMMRLTALNLSTENRAIVCLIIAIGVFLVAFICVLLVIERRNYVRVREVLLHDDKHSILPSSRTILVRGIPVYRRSEEQITNMFNISDEDLAETYITFEQDFSKEESLAKLRAFWLNELEVDMLWIIGELHRLGPQAEDPLSRLEWTERAYELALGKALSPEPDSPDNAKIIRHDAKLPQPDLAIGSPGSTKTTVHHARLPASDLALDSPSVMDMLPLTSDQSFELTDQHNAHLHSDEKVNAGRSSSFCRHTQPIVGIDHGNWSFINSRSRSYIGSTRAEGAKLHFTEIPSLEETSSTIGYHARTPSMTYQHLAQRLDGVEHLHTDDDLQNDVTLHSKYLHNNDYLHSDEHMSSCGKSSRSCSYFFRKHTESMVDLDYGSWSFVRSSFSRSCTGSKRNEYMQHHTLNLSRFAQPSIRVYQHKEHVHSDEKLNVGHALFFRERPEIISYDVENAETQLPTTPQCGPTPERRTHPHSDEKLNVGHSSFFHQHTEPVVGIDYGDWSFIRNGSRFPRSRFEKYGAGRMHRLLPESPHILNIRPERRPRPPLTHPDEIPTACYLQEKFAEKHDQAATSPPPILQGWNELTIYRHISRVQAKLATVDRNLKAASKSENRPMLSACFITFPTAEQAFNACSMPLPPSMSRVTVEMAPHPKDVRRPEIVREVDRLWPAWFRLSIHMFLTCCALDWITTVPAAILEEPIIKFLEWLPAWLASPLLPVWGLVFLVISTSLYTLASMILEWLAQWRSPGERIPASHARISCRTQTLNLLWALFVVVSWNLGDPTLLLASISPKNAPEYAATTLAHLGNSVCFVQLAQALQNTALACLKPVELLNRMLCPPYYTPRDVYLAHTITPLVGWPEIYNSVTLPVVWALWLGLVVPSVSACCIVAVFMISMANMYSVLYTSNADYNTNGAFFQRALSHIFFGIYLLEASLFVLAYALLSDKPDSPAYIAFGLLAATLVLAVVVQLWGWRPVNFVVNKKEENPNNNNSTGQDCGGVSLADLSPSDRSLLIANAYRHPGAKVPERGIAWIPKDFAGYSDVEIERAWACHSGSVHMSNEGAAIAWVGNRGLFRAMSESVVANTPPDYNDNDVIEL